MDVFAFYIHNLNVFWSAAVLSLDCSSMSQSIIPLATDHAWRHRLAEKDSQSECHKVANLTTGACDFGGANGGMSTSLVLWFCSCH